MRKVMMLAAAMGLSFLAFQSNGAVAVTCQEQCRIDDVQCHRICDKNPCFVSCEYLLQRCLDNCGSES